VKPKTKTKPYPMKTSLKKSIRSRGASQLFSVLFALAGLSALVPNAGAASRVWTNAPTDGNWSNPNNWDILTVPAANDLFVFNTSSLTLSTNDILAANANVNGITFAAGGNAFTLYGNGITVNGNITNASANAQTINMDTLINNSDRDIVGNANVTLGGLTLNNGNNRTLYNWLTNGTVTLNNVTLSEAAATARTFSILGAASGNTALANTIISGVVANGSTAGSTLQYFGTGTLKLNGSAVSTYTGASSITAGTLLLDFANLASGVNLLDPGSALTLGGGTYGILGRSSGSTFQTNGNLTMTAGTGSGITLNNNGGAGTTLSLGTLGGRGGNSTLAIDTSAGGTLVVGTRPTVVNGILSPAYATVKDGSGTGFATTNTGNTITRYAGATALVDTANNPTVNYVYTANGSTFNWNNGITSRGANSLTIDTTAAGGVLDLGGAANVLTNSSRAILMTGDNNFTIQNGQVGSEAVEQMVHVTGAGVLTISGTVGSGTASLTKGGSGTLVLNVANNYSNGTFVAEGTLKQGVANAFGNTNRTMTVGAGGVLDLNGIDLNVGLLNGNGGGIIVNNGGVPATLTIGNGNPANGGSTSYTLMDGVSPLKLKMVGSQQLQISGASSWSGGTEITGGNPIGIRINNSQAFGTGPVTLNDGGVFVTSASPLPGGLGFVIPNNIVAVGNSANNALVVDANLGYTWAGNFTGSGTVKVNAGTRTGFNANYTGDLTLFNGTFNVANGGASTFQARLTQNGGAAAKFALTTTGSQISFNGTGATGTNVSLGELSGVSVTRISGDNAAKTFSIGALGTSSTFGGVIDNGNAVMSVTKVGAGSLTLGTAATYTGATVVSNGLLFVSGLASTNTVNVSAPGGFGGAGTVAGPVVLSSGNAGLWLTNSATGTLTVGDGTTGLTLANGNVLAFDVGANPISDSITVNGSFTQTGTNTVVIAQAAGFGAGTYTLLTAGGGVSAANFALGNTFPGYSMGLTDDGTHLYLTVSVVAPSAAFWHNRSGTTWNTANNWDTDAGSGTALTSVPSNPTDITFASTLANNFNTTLGADMGIHNLDFVTANAVSVGGANTLTVGGNVTVESGAGNPSISAGGVALGVDQAWTVTDAGQTLSVSSPVSGAKNLAIAGAGTVALSGTSSYSGGTFITGTAKLTLGAPGDTLANAGAVAIDGGTLSIGANSDIVGVVGLTNGAITGTSGVLTGSVYYAENGLISARLGGTANFTKGNTGTVLISGSNTFSGTVFIVNGTLQLGSSNALGTGSATVANGATLDLNGQTNYTVTSVTGGGYSGAGAIINSSNAPAAIFAEIGNGQALTVNNVGDITLQRVRSGGGSFELTKTGPGTLTLGTPAATSHNNLMELLVSQGKVVLNMPGFLAVDRDPCAVDTGATLQLAGTGGNQINDGSDVILNTGGLFDLNGRSELIGSLTNYSGSLVTNSLPATNSVLTVGGGNGGTATGTSQVDGQLAGNLGLSMSGSGIMTLTADNPFTGNTTVNAGTIALSGSGSIGNSAMINIVSGATLDVSARTDVALTLNSGQTLIGNGGIYGSLTNLSGSVVSPGTLTAVGNLGVTNDITLKGTLRLKLNRGASPNHDVLTSVSGTINYGGTLTVTNIGAVLQTNDTFQLFPSAVTTFSGINLATTDATGNTYTWENDVATLGSIKVLTVTPSINPNPPQLQVSVSGSTMSLAWPTNRGWILQSNSVSLTATSSWFPFPADGSVTVTNVNIPVNPTKTNVFFRMLKP
jgi:fibronectin-binding autotransporter adhesin